MKAVIRQISIRHFRDNRAKLTLRVAQPPSAPGAAKLATVGATAVATGRRQASSRVAVRTAPTMRRMRQGDFCGIALPWFAYRHPPRSAEPQHSPTKSVAMYGKFKRNFSAGPSGAQLPKTPLRLPSIACRRLPIASGDGCAPAPRGSEPERLAVPQRLP